MDAESLRVVAMTSIRVTQAQTRWFLDTKFDLLDLEPLVMIRNLFGRHPDRETTMCTPVVLL